MRRTSDEERDLFLSALSGRMPVKRAVSKKAGGTKSSRSAAKKSAVPQEKPVAGTRGRRHATQDEMDLFLFAVTGQSPVKEQPKQAKSKASTAPAAKPPKSSVGLDGNTLRRLTRGELAPSAKLDLHGLTEAAAHGALTAFVLAAHKRGDRLVLIVTGKGSVLSESGRGVLKQMVPRWLEEAPMVKIIAEKRWAHRRHGGEGALYVYLRKR